MVQLGKLGRTPIYAVVDYGGGNGLLSLLAREAGSENVVYTDIEAASTEDARLLAAALDLEASHYVVGELDDVLAYTGTHGVQVGSVCSYDVIEDVYDINAFLGELPRISGGPLRIVMASGANGANPRIRRNLERLHRERESVGMPVEWGHKPSATAEPYLAIRAAFVRESAPDLQEGDVEQLATLTRGMAEQDVRAAGVEYLGSGTLPAAPEHPTNTCDPYNGNWAEHVMDPDGLASTLRTAGMEAWVQPGYYKPYIGLRGVVSRGLNMTQKALGGRGFVLAPYYILMANRT